MKSLTKEEKLFWAKGFLLLSMGMTILGVWLSNSNLGYAAYFVVFLGLAFAYLKIGSIRDYFHSDR